RIGRIRPRSASNIRRTSSAASSGRWASCRAAPSRIQMRNKSNPEHSMKLITTLASLVLAVTALADDAGFKPLFNGKDLTGWHLRRPDAQSSWTVADGVLKNTVEPGHHGVDLVSDAKFWN